MARLKGSDLKEIIRAIVRQEIKEVVSETINEVLSERYLKEVAARMVENAGPKSRPRGVASLEIMGDEAPEEATPRALDNSDEWPFRKHPSKHDDSIDEASDPMDIFFEGTKPLAAMEAEADEKALEKVDRAMSSPEGQNQVALWRKLNEGMARKTAEKANGLSPEEQMRRLEEKRKQLEVKVR